MSETCARCECPIRDGGSYVCDSCAEDEDAEIEARLADEDSWPRCGCPYCFCLLKTEYGEPCDSCAHGCHQG